MKRKILTLALASIFGLGLTNAQEVKKVKSGTQKEAKAIKKEARKEARHKHGEMKKTERAITE